MWTRANARGHHRGSSPESPRGHLATVLNSQALVAPDSSIDHPAAGGGPRILRTEIHNLLRNQRYEVLAENSFKNIKVPQYQCVKSKLCKN